MADGLEEIEMPVHCPGCGINTLSSVRELALRQQLACRACGTNIDLNGRVVRDTIRDAEKSIARIRRGFPGAP